MSSTVDVAPKNQTESSAAKGEALIPTARGDAVPASQLGLVNAAELIIQSSPEVMSDWPDQSWGALPEEQQIAKVVAVLNHAHAGGVGAIIDRTIPGVGRDVARMKKIALQTQLNILVTTGYYALYNLPYYWRYLQEMPEKYPHKPKLHDLLARDVTHGVGNTGVRAVAIKVASDKWGLEETPDLRGLFKSTSIAHRISGGPITTHGVGIADALRHQNVFAAEGVDLTRVLLGHMDRSANESPLDDFVRALDRGSYISFDGWFPAGPNPLASDPGGPEDSLRRIASLVQKGYAQQIVLSGGWPIAFYDIFADDFFPDDGVEPYMRVIDKVIPGLRAHGVSDANIHLMTHVNAQRYLSSRAKGGY